jgi:PAS domain S-box-containing protein
MLPGIVASLILSGILVLVLRDTVGRGRLMLWLAGIVGICLVRLSLLFYYRKIEKTTRSVWRFQILALVSLAAIGILWGGIALFPLPPDLLSHHVFIALLLGGMVAGTVGLYSVTMPTFFIFSVPALLPIVLVFFLAGTPFFSAMGFMSLLFWGIMTVTAFKLNRDITGYLMAKYQNQDLISDLEAEMAARRAAEEGLKKRNQEIEGIVARRTEELLATNSKLIREMEGKRLVAAALEENEAKFRDMVESINDVIYSADDQGIVNYVSPVARTVLGYEPEELVGKNFEDYVHKDDCQTVSGLLPKRMAGDSRSVEYRFRTGTNEFRWIRSSSRGIFKDGNFVGIRGVLTDISEKRKLEEQLRRIHKMEAVATLSGGVAHDFNNLLAVILGNTELAMMNPEASPSVHSNLEKIIDSSMRAKAIVKELLSFACQSNVERKPINIATAVLEEVGRLEATLPASVTLEKDIANDIGTTLGDDEKVGQVVANLWDNAVEAMSDRGGILSITVKAVELLPDDIDFDPDMAPGRYIQLRVRDTGVGIRPGNIGRLFDPYYTTKMFGGGDGLGLAVVHGIVKRHGGGIRVASAPEKGACFDVFFSAAEVRGGARPPVTV